MKHGITWRFRAIFFDFLWPNMGFRPYPAGFPDLSARSRPPVGSEGHIRELLPKVEGLKTWSLGSSLALET